MLVAGETCNADVGGGMMPTPEGSVPAVTVAVTVFVAVAITETVLEPTFVT
jgi:hypothetical protein